MVYTMKYFTVHYLVSSQLINTWRQPEILEIAAQERERETETFDPSAYIATLIPV